MSVTHTQKRQAARAHNGSHSWRVALGKVQQTHKPTQDIRSGSIFWWGVSAPDLVVRVEKVDENSLEQVEASSWGSGCRPPRHYELAFITVQRVGVTSGTGI